MKKIAILGSGSWGTALGIQLSKKNSVIMWTLNEEQAKEFNIDATNKKYLPGIKMPVNLKCITNLELAVKNADIIILAVPSQAIRSICRDISKFTNDKQIIINVAKGIESSTGLRLSEVCAEELPNNTYAVLSGPSHAEEVAKDIPTTLVIASKSVEARNMIQEEFSNKSLRIYSNNDVVGVELGGALKNIIAFGAGICDGLGYGDNTKAALVTRGVSEISRLGIEMGALPETFGGLTGIGDLIVTCTSKHSRNRNAGYLIGKGYSLKDALDEVEMVVEGVVATQAAHKLSKELKIEMPIVNAIYNILYNNLNPHEAVVDLMMREQKHEYEDLYIDKY